jgi:hypothetical protein
MTDPKQPVTHGGPQPRGNLELQEQVRGGGHAYWTSNQDAARSDARSTGGLGKFKEVVTAIIASAVLAVTIWMLVGTFNSASLKEPEPPKQSEPIAGQDTQAMQQRLDKRREESLRMQQDAFNNRKDVMLYGLSLLGAIIGYYFGRVPAELHAQAAQRAANNAQQQLNTTQGDLKTANATAITATQNANAANAKAEQVTEKSEQLKKDVKNSLTALKSKITAVRVPAKTLGAGAPASGSLDLEQAERDIDALLTTLENK